ncbi:MAG TPA: ribonuclease Z [Anaeromyxobacteraceae bacterium]|nr:ribonuclease Z [Anaeromyxobacteraceae bacterium]
MLRLTFLGTSGAMPTAARNLSGLSVRHGREHYLVDCGEGTQRQMIRFGTGFDVTAICFTHFHADHYVGAIGFVRTLSMLGRERPLDVYGPAPAHPFLDGLLLGGTDPLAFEIRIHEVRPGDAIRRDGATLRPWATRHRIASVGWVLEEDPRPGRFHPERARAAGVPEGELWGELQRGRSVLLPGGRVVSPSAIVDPPRRGRRLAVTGDTRPCPTTPEAARAADLLVHECTFGDGEAARAVETTHSTAREAGRMAREAGAARLVLTHLSTRYDADPSPLLQQAGEEFAGPVEVARDGLVVELPRPE